MFMVSFLWRHFHGSNLTIFFCYYPLLPFSLSPSDNPSPEKEKMIPDEKQGVLPKIPHKGVFQPRLYQTPGILDVVPGCGFRDIVIFLAVDSVLVTCVGRVTSRPVTTDCRKREIKLTLIFRVLTFSLMPCGAKTLIRCRAPKIRERKAPRA